MIEPLVSYIVPFWNPCSEGRSLVWFVECIESLRKQTHQTCEFIFVNDGSTDNSGDVVKAVALYDPRVKLLGASGSENHQGLITALNLGLAKAKGDYIARLDSDDIALPDRTQKQLAFFRDHPEVHVLGGAMLPIDARSVEIIRSPRALSFIDVRQCARCQCPFHHPTVMFRRLVYDQLGGYPEGYECAEDYAYWVRVLKHFRGENMSEPLSMYRLHETQVSVQYCVKQQKTTARIECEARMLDVLSPADKLRRAYCEVFDIAEKDLGRRANENSSRRNAPRLLRWRREYPDAPQAEFYASADGYYDEMLYWNTVRLWDGRWKLVENYAKGMTLDFGGGLGFAALLTPLEYHHYDPSPFCRKVVQQHTPKARILETPEITRQYDTVICIEVLKYVDAPLLQLIKLIAAVKRDGYLILVPDVPALDGEGMERVTDHVWRKVKDN